MAHVFCHKWDKNKKSPHSINYAGDCSEQFNRTCNNGLEPLGRQFCYKNGYAYTYRRSDKYGEKGYEQGSIYGRQSPEYQCYWVPHRSGYKSESEPLY